MSNITRFIELDNYRFNDQIFQKLDNLLSGFEYKELQLLAEIIRFEFDDNNVGKVLPERKMKKHIFRSRPYRYIRGEYLNRYTNLRYFIRDFMQYFNIQGVSDTAALPLERELKNYAYPRYELFEKRLMSLTNWPISINQKPNALADAGFFYNNFSDQVTCFSCGINICKWTPTDDPWNVHIKFMKHPCEYVKTKKNEAFIEHCMKETIEQLAIPSGSALTIKEEPEPIVINTINSDLLCGICMEDRRNILFMPCNHLFSCRNCSFAVTLCPLCRCKIDNQIRVFY